MNKITYIYSLIGSELILKKYGLTMDDVFSNKAKVSKKTLFKDIKSFLVNLKEENYLKEDEYSFLLSEIKDSVKSASEFMEAISPFLIAVTMKGSSDTSSD